MISSKFNDGKNNNDNMANAGGSAGVVDLVEETTKMLGTT